ncbi:hypothetical protein Tco_0497857 [Tanacetum coccineum]
MIICNLFYTTMTTLADKSLLSGGDNKPPMLEKHLYDSWKSRMELYMMNRPHGRMILDLLLAHYQCQSALLTANNMKDMQMKFVWYYSSRSGGRKRDETWFNDKVLLVQAQAGGQALTEEEIAFLADPGLPDIQTS